MEKELQIFDDYIVVVDDMGHVFHNNKELKQVIDSRSGYLTISIRGNHRYVHRLVASAFIQPLKIGDRSIQVHHINKNKLDNRLENLQIMTRDEHMYEHKQIYPITKKCVVCGKEFTPHKTKRKRALTCSRDCALQLITKSNRESCGRPIIQYGIDGEFVKRWECGTDIERELNIYQSNVVKCCKHQIQTYKGFVWRYEDEQ